MTHKCNNNCKGQKYKGLQIQCNRCESFMFIECIAKEGEMKNFLHFFEIVEYGKEKEDKKKDYIEKGETKINSLLYKGSMFKFNCPSCKDDPNNANSNENNSEQSQQMNTSVATMHSIIDKLKSDINDLDTEFNDLVTKTENSSTQFCLQNANINTKPRGVKAVQISAIPRNNNNNEIDPNSGHYEIYIAKFEKTITCENVVDRIISSTNISDKRLFNVQMLGGKRDYHTFVSFKATTLDHDICNSILNMDWNEQNASIFTSTSSHKKGNHEHPKNKSHRNNNKRQNHDPSKDQRNNRNRRDNQHNYYDQTPRYHNRNYNFEHRVPRNNYQHYRSYDNHEYGQRRNFYDFNNYNHQNHERYRPTPQQQSNRFNYDPNNFLDHRPRSYHPRMYNENYQYNHNHRN